MYFSQNQIKRAFTALFFSTFLITGCSKNCRSWLLDTSITACPCFNSARLLLPPDNEFSRLSIELFRNTQGIRIYINVLLYQATPSTKDPSKTDIQISTPTGTKTIEAFLLKGGQKILIPEEDSEDIVRYLLNDQSLRIKIGRYETLILSENFKPLYEAFLNVPIGE